MRYLIQRIRQRVTARRSLVALALLALAPACDRDDPLPTGPPVAAPAPLAAILGADVSGLGFDAVAINESGQVAGTLNGRAVLWTPGGGMQDLGTLGGTSSWAYAINESGQVAGASLTSTGNRHAFLWTPGEGMLDLGAFVGGTSSTARGINDLGQVVGESNLPRVEPREPERHAFLWSATQGMQDLGALGQGLTSSIAFDINNAGQVVGRGFSADRIVLPPTDPEYYSRAFLWEPGQGMRDLGASVAYAINDAGQVVGRTWGAVGPPGYGELYRAFLWTSGQGVQILGGLWLGPSFSAAYGINNAGQVVGESDLGIFYRAGYPVQGFLWTAMDGMEALSPTTGIRAARAINNRQQVVGDGRVATLHLTPGNSPPVAVTNGPYSGLRRSAVPLNLSGADNDDVGFVYTTSFGDGEDWIDINPPSSHTYANNGTYTLTLTVRDRRGATDTKTTTVTIANVPPTILAGGLTGPTAPVQLTGGSASAPITLKFSDPGRSNDIYSAEIACGNGVVLAPTNIPVSDTYLGNGVYTGIGTYAGECTYTSAGVYTVRATVSDDAGGTSAPAYYRYVVVFDPNGGSTSGNGFYDVPGHGKTKARFTFDVGFPPHATVPNGTAKFWIPDGGMSFESTVIEMLVISGNWTQFWGIGTFNGAPARFRITAIAGEGHGNRATKDALRIEVWQAGTLVFDSQPGTAQDAPVTTEIDGGNIRIHSG